MRPDARCGQAKVTELHGAVLCQKDVLRLDITMVESIDMHMVDCIDELEHETTNVFCLQWTSVESDSLIEITLRAVLKDQVGMGAGFEVMDEIDQMGVVLQDAMTLELPLTFVGVGSVRSVGSNLRLCQAFDGHLFLCCHVFS